jgi:hypothetical protein
LLYPGVRILAGEAHGADKVLVRAEGWVDHGKPEVNGVHYLQVDKLQMWADTQATHKRRTFACLPSPIQKFAGLTSRNTTPLEWQNSSRASSCRDETTEVRQGH